MRLLFQSLAVFIILSHSIVFAQLTDIKEKTFFYPHFYRSGQIISSLGLSTAKLPEDVVETDDVFRGPIFAYRMKYGLPENFVAEGAIESNIITFNFSAGPKWNYSIDRWGFSAGVDISYWIGRLKQFGFDTKAYGWMLYPNISAGYRFDRFALTIKSEVVLNLAQYSKNGEIELSTNMDTYNGYTVGIYLEQPLWKDNYVVIGIRSTFLKFYYPMWAAFSTFDRAFYIPEATFTFIL